MRRPGDRSRAEAHGAIRRTILKHWRLQLGLIPIFVFLPLWFAVWPITPLQKGFLAGAFITAAIAIDLWYMTVGTLGATFMLNGADGELLTSEQFTRRGRRRAGWEVVHGLVLNDHEIDHVAIGPGGAYAIETKWIGGIRACQLSDHGLVGYKGLDPIAQARISASRVHSFLRSHTAGSPVEADVRPLLVLWGPGSPDFDGPRDIRGVTVIRGKERAQWNAVLDGTSSQSNFHGAARKVRVYAKVQYAQL